MLFTQTVLQKRKKAGFVFSEAFPLVDLSDSGYYGSKSLHEPTLASLNLLNFFERLSKREHTSLNAVQISALSEDFCFCQR